MPPLRNMPPSERCTCCAKMFCRGNSSPELVSVNVQTLQLCASEKSCITCQRFALCHRVSPPTIMGSVTPHVIPAFDPEMMTLAHFITGSRPNLAIQRFPCRAEMCALRKSSPCSDFFDLKDSSRSNSSPGLCFSILGIGAVSYTHLTLPTILLV